MAAITESRHPSRFESLEDLRDEHARLLDTLDQKLDRRLGHLNETDAILAMESEVRGFIVNGTASGCYLEEIEDRIAGQALIDYWVSNLVRAGLEVDKGHLAPFDAERLPELPDEPHPYVGLKAFDENDSQIFFGRTADVEVIVKKVRDMPLVAVFGASGSGKSSLVMGGVIPLLKTLEGSKFRYIPPFTPGNAPIFQLVRAARRLGPAPEKTIEADVQRLREDPGYLAALLGGEDSPPVMIVIDQFEELFTLSEDSGEMALFAGCLAGLLATQRCHRIVLTVREEFDDKMVVLTDLADYLKPEARYVMRPMSYEDLRLAIEGPAERVKLQFQPGIVDDIVRKVLGQPAVLPLLQFTLRRLWERRHRNRITWEIYKAVGDYQGDDKPYGPLQALSRSADDFYDGKSPEDQHEIRRILLEMVRVNELLEAYRQPVLKKQLIDGGKANTPRVLELLADADYVQVTPGENQESTVIGIKHESLIRNWKRLVDWIGEKRESYKQRLALTQAANRWHKAGRPREGLLTGWQLHYARQQTGLSDLETEFIEASGQAIDFELRRKQSRRRRKLRIVKLFIAMLILGAFALWATDHYYWQERQRTWIVLDELERLADADKRLYVENRLDNVAIYLWNKRQEDPNAVETLLAILSEADRRGLFKPDFYPVNEWQAMEEGIQAISKTQESSIVNLHIPKNVAIKKGILQKSWREYAEKLWAGGIPMPARLNVVGSGEGDTAIQLKVLQPKLKNTAPDKKAATASQTSKPKSEPAADAYPFAFGTETATLEKTDFSPEQILLSDLEFESKSEIKALFAQPSGLLKARKAFEELSVPGWWWAPRWTVPLWKAAGIKNYYPPEVSLMVRAMVRLNREPTLIYSDGVNARLIRWQFWSTPDTVEAACRAVGNVPTLIDATKRLLLKDSFPLSMMQYAFETLTYRTKERPTIADANCLDTLVTEGNNSEAGNFIYEVDEAFTGAYKPEQPIWVLFSPDLRAAIAPTGVLDEGVAERTNELRSRLARENGFKMPGVKFISDESMSHSQFTLKLFLEFATETYRASPGHEVEDILKKLEERVLRTRPLWINLEETARLKKELPPDITQWLASRNYDLIHLKQLLREILAKGWNLRPGFEAGVDEAPLAGASLIHFPWLMRSLVFWDRACRHSQSYDGCLGEGLRKTQKARLIPKSPAEFPQQFPSTIPGLDTLVSGKFAEAGNAFEQWLARTGRDTAEDDFVRAYGKLAPRIEYLAFENACNPEPGRFASHESLVRTAETAQKIDAFVEDYLPALPSDLKRRMLLCQASSGFVQGAEPNRWQKAIETLLHEHQDWTPEERYWLAYLGLKAHLTSQDANDKAPPFYVDQLSTLLLASISSFAGKQADLAFEDFWWLCTGPDAKAGAWCLDMLKSAPGVKKDSYWIPYELAYSLGQRSRKDALDALTLLDQAERNLGQVEKTRQKAQQAVLAYARGLAHQTLGHFGSDQNYRKAIEFFTEAAKLGDRPKSELDPGLAYDALARTLFYTGDLTGAGQALMQGRSRAKAQDGMAALDATEVVLLWSKGQFGETVEILKGKEDDSSLFMRGLARMLAEGPFDRVALAADLDRFYRTSHPYRDYLRLLNYWMQARMGDAGKAKKGLEARWQAIDAKRWKERLKPDRGDYTGVWREMLVGYYLGHVKEHEIAELLEGTNIPGDFKSSPLANAEQSRQGFLCEWYFYQALLLWTQTGDSQAMRDSLVKATETLQKGFHEYSMANDLIRRIDGKESFKLP